MSSLLLSQSIISSTENSLREKSLQQQRKIHQHQRHHLHPNHIGGPYNRNFSVGKNDSYQYNNRPQLVVTEVPDRQSTADISKFCWLIFISVLVLICEYFAFNLFSF